MKNNRAKIRLPVIEENRILLEGLTSIRKCLKLLNYVPGMETFKTFSESISIMKDK